MADANDLAISSLQAPSFSSDSRQSPEQLRALAAQFESLLLGQMLKEMRQSMFSDDAEGDGAGFGSGPLADTIFSELSVALARSGGMGLTTSLMGPLMAQAGIAPEALGADAAVPAEIPLPAGLDLPAASPIAAPMAAVAAAMPGRMSSGYGWRKDPINGQAKFHKGVDIAMPVGGDVPSARGGEVTFAGEMNGYGLTVVVKHDERTSTRYAHLSEILVTPGDQVTAGQTIAHSGATGRVTGPHLHFEVIEGGVAVDPSQALASGL
jgi:murein DD-endopeptidase MepM/ murein hydrolase activator NlpD